MQHDCFPGATPDWPKGPLSVLAEQSPRYPVKKGIEYPFLEMAAVAENFGGILKWDLRRLEGSGLARFKSNDTLFAKITPCPENGKVAFVSGMPGETGLGSTEFIVLSPRDGTDPRFLYHLACAYDVRGRATARMEGSTGRQRVPEDVFDRRLLVPRPDPDEQTAIAYVLDAVDTAIEWAREALSNAESLDHSLLHDLLDGGKNRPAHWVTKYVDEVANVGSGVTLGKDVTGYRHVELPYLRVANVQDGRLDLSTIKTVKVRCDEVERYRLEPGDVLMTEGGDLDKLGRGTLWEGQIDNCLHQNHIFRIRTDRAQLDPRYFAFVVESDIAKRYFNRVAKRTTNLASTNKTQVRAFQFPLPRLDEQAQIAATMTASKAILSALKSKVEAFQQLKRSLLRDLLTGAVRVNAAMFPSKAAA
jgi:type I restriction enzyme S subunit